MVTAEASIECLTLLHDCLNKMG